MRTRKEKLKRFCEVCGKELIYIELPNGRLYPCDYDGPSPYLKNKNGACQFVTQGRELVIGYSTGPSDASGYGYRAHQCPQARA